MTQFHSGDGDNELIHESLAGNEKAIEQMINTYQPLVYSLALKFVGKDNTYLAEEVTQDSLLKALHSLKSFKFRSKFSTWLYTIVYYTAVDSMKANKTFFTELKEEHTELQDVDDWNFSSIDFKSFQDKIKEAIGKLEREDELLLTLFYLNEESIQGISKITGLKENNVKVKLFRARQKLKDELSSLYKMNQYEKYQR